MSAWPSAVGGDAYWALTPEVAKKSQKPMAAQAPERQASRREPQGKWVRSRKVLGAMSGALLGSLGALPGLPGRDLVGDPGVEGVLQASAGSKVCFDTGICTG